MYEPPAATPQHPPVVVPQSPTIAAEALPRLLAMLASLHTTREPLAVALDTVDKEIARVMTLAHQAMSAMGARHFATAEATLELKPQVVYKPTDWTALHAHIQTTGEFDLLHRRLSSTALQQRGESLPPGVMRDTFDVPKFSLAKGAR